MVLDKNASECEQISIEKYSINGFSIEVIKAYDLYMCLDIFWKFDDWLKCVTAQLKAARDFYHMHSEKGSVYLFSIKAAKDIAMENDSLVSKKVANYLLAYEVKMKKNTFENIFLSDSDKSALVRNFSTAIGCDEQTVMVSNETLISMVDTIRLCKMQIDQIQKRLSKFDFSDIDHIG